MSFKKDNPYLIAEKTTQRDNQKAYDASNAREKYCFVWLKSKKKTVNRLINIVALIGVINGVLIILQSAILAYIFQQLIIEKQQWNQLSYYFIVLTVVFIFRSLCSYYFQVLGYKVAVTIKRSVREQLLNQFFLLGPAYIKQQQTGELAASTLEHTEALEGYFSRYLPQQMIVALLPLLMIAVVMPVNWVVGLIFLITGPLIPVFMALVGMGAASANRNQFLAMARMNGYFLDRLEGLTTLKLFGQTAAELKAISKVSAVVREKTMTVLRIAFLSSAVLEFFSAIAVALVAVYVGLGLLGLIHFGPAIDISLQEALFVLLLAPEFFNPLKQFATHYHDKAAAIGAADHILKILDQVHVIEPEISSTVDTLFCIELKNVSKCFQQKEVLKSINLQIKAGEKIALTGESGVGKTTLFNLLLGFEEASTGDVLIEGSRATRQNTENLIAWVGQKSTLFYATIADNISLLDSSIPYQQIEAAADAAGVTEFSKHLDNGLLTLVGEKGYGLSGGQIQRIALARTFVKNAPIVLLDEPTAHLDLANKTRLLNVIDSVFKDKTLIIASHDPLVTARMDRTVCLS
ncbi:MAG: thiol reductant ABC exporter subunit CydD [Methylococcaceae bacterium]|nr:thiol reductant ABC exporter subunit CydD [Methylococcaceae bacterium]